MPFSITLLSLVKIIINILGKNKAMIKQDIVYAKYGVLLFLSNLSLDQYHKGA